MLRQLTLDLGTPPPSTFDNFFAGTNAELVTRLRELEGALAVGPVADRTFYVWGETGSGRSHLLKALVENAQPGLARFASPQSGLAAFALMPTTRLIATTNLLPSGRNEKVRSSKSKSSIMAAVFLPKDSRTYSMRSTRPKNTAAAQGSAYQLSNKRLKRILTGK